jgi:hypothetical protein
MVGHPEDIHGLNGEYRALLDDVAVWSPRLHLSIDDREGYHYPECTHHIRIELV